MKILILAAGTGSRLGPLTRNTPKSLLDLGNGMTLLETQLEAARQNGIHDVVLVTGYRSSQIEAKIQYYDGLNFEVVYNPFYEVSNNLVSAWMALPYVRDEFVLVNGDDVFKSEVLGRLLAADGEVVMMISSKPGYDDDDMKVHIHDSFVKKVSKQLTAEEANGEAIGMHKFSRKGRDWIVAELNRMVHHKENLNAYYLSAMQNLMDAGLPVKYASCAPDEWSEIDFHPDLELLKQRLRNQRLS